MAILTLLTLQLVLAVFAVSTVTIVWTVFAVLEFLPMDSFCDCEIFGRFDCYDFFGQVGRFNNFMALTVWYILTVALTVLSIWYFWFYGQGIWSDPFHSLIGSQIKKFHIK